MSIIGNYYSEMEDMYNELDIETIVNFEAIDILTYFESILDFSEKIKRKIVIQNEYLYLSNFDMRIELDSLFDKQGRSKDFILDILDKADEYAEYRDKKEIKSLIYTALKNKNYGEDPTDTSVNKALSRIWKEFEVFNEKIEKSSGIKDFFVINNKKIKINDMFL